MRALFVTKTPHDIELPPMDSEDTNCLHFTEDGILKGGYSCIGRESKEGTILIWVEASQAVLLSMKNSPKYLALGYINQDGDPTLLPIKYYRDWFIAHPVLLDKIQATGVETIEELIVKICKWHDVTREELKAAGV